MNKRSARMLWALALAAVIVLALCAPAFAQPEPEAEGEGAAQASAAHYMINGKKGYADVFRTSECRETADQLVNGNIVSVTIESTAPDGTAVALIGYRMENGEICPDDAGDGMSGWVVTDELLEQPGPENFLRDHEAEFTAYSGQLDRVVTQGTPVVLYTYPGSGVVAHAFGQADEYLLPKSVYTDENGEAWAYVSYYYGETGWVSVSDPSNDSLEPAPREEAELIPPRSPQEAAKRQSAVNTACLVLAAALVILGFVFIARKRSREKAAAQEIIELDERPIPQYVPVDVTEFDPEEAPAGEEPAVQIEEAPAVREDPALAEAGKQLFDALSTAAEQEKPDLTVEQAEAVAAVKEAMTEQAEAAMTEPEQTEAEAIQTEAKQAERTAAEEAAPSEEPAHSSAFMELEDDGPDAPAAKSGELSDFPLKPEARETAPTQTDEAPAAQEAPAETEAEAGEQNG